MAAPLLFAAFMIGLMLYTSFNRSSTHTEALNLAGKQRMLIERHMKEVLLASNDGAQDLYKTTRVLLNKNIGRLKTLNEGNSTSPQSVISKLEEQADFLLEIFTSTSEMLEVGADSERFAELRAHSLEHTQDFFDAANETVTLFAEASDAAQLSAGRRGTFLGLGATALAFALALLLAHRLQGRTRSILEAMNQAALGHLDSSAKVEGSDEFGQISTSLDQLLMALRITISNLAEQIEGLRNASSRLDDSSRKMDATMDETSRRADAISSATRQVDSSVQDAVQGWEQMGLSIQKISASAQEAAHVAASAVDIAASTNEMVGKLGQNSAEIGEVIRLINSIAEQTNLLALNATIEAARAGEAGKGFAVVANEVKELAKETGVATEKINDKISTIQSDTTSALRELDQFVEIISQINERQASIAASVEEQTTTVSTISHNMKDIQQATGDIVTSIGDVTDSVQSASQVSGDSRKAAEQVSGLASQLQEVVEIYRAS